MKTPFIYGTQLLTADDKKRITIGADFRRLIDPEMAGGAFVITLFNGIPCLYPERYYEELMNAQLPPQIAPDRDLVEYTQLKFALAVTAKLDAQWRITLPDSVIKDANLGTDLALVGNRDHLQLHDRKSWEILRAKLIKESGAIEARATAALKSKKDETHP